MPVFFFFFHLLGFGERCAYLGSNSILNRIASKGGYLWRTKNKGNWGLLLVAVKQCHEKGVCHGKSWFNWIQPLIVNAMHWCYKFSFCCSRWYQVWECADYVLQLALPCWLCIFQTHLHSIWWPLRFLFFLWHWWTKTLLSCTWGFFFFLLLCLFYLFLLQLS